MYPGLLSNDLFILIGFESLILKSGMGLVYEVKTLLNIIREMGLYFKYMLYCKD